LPDSASLYYYFSFLLLVCLGLVVPPISSGQSDPQRCARKVETPLPWPDGIIPYEISRLNSSQKSTVLKAMQRWMDTGARIAFVPRSNESAYVNFTGRTDAGNNTSLTGFKAGARADINITAFWWSQSEWMPAHELGHVLGFHHEHARWDRDRFVTIHYEHIKAGRAEDYNWIPQTNWLVGTTRYDYYSIMHYRTCWASSCESQCKDGDGSSPCAVIDPIGTNYDQLIGQWDQNGISRGDAEKARLAYGVGQSIYVQSGHAGVGSGTLEDPYSDLAHARRKCPQNARIITVSQGGAWSMVRN
jgi:tolloid protein